MKSRLLQYTLFALIITPFLLTDVAEKLNFLRWIAFPIIFLALGFLIYKTGRSGKMKKFVFLLTLTLSINVGAQIFVPMPAQAADTGKNCPPAVIKTCSGDEKLKKLLCEQANVLEKIKEARCKGESTSSWTPNLGFIGINAGGGLDGELDRISKEIQKEEQVAAETCKTPAQLMRENCNSCWPCSLIKMILDAIDTVAIGFYEAMRLGGDPTGKSPGYPTKVLAFGFLFWILFHVLKLVVSFSDSKFFSTFFKQTFFVVVAWAFLQLPLSDVMDWFVTPFFNFGEGLSQTFTDLNPGGDTGAVRIDEALYKQFNTPKSSCQYQIEQPKGKTAFSPELRSAILRMTSNLYSTISPPTVIGQSIMCYAKQKGFRIPGFNIRIPKIGMYCMGGFIVASFSLMMVIVPFYFMDAFVKIGFVLVLLPFYIVAAAFAKTRVMTKNALQILLAALATFIASCVIMVFVVQVFYAGIVGNPRQMARYLAGQDGGIAELYDLMNGGSFVMILLTTYIGFKMVGMIDKLASALLGSGADASGSGAYDAAQGGMSAAQILGGFATMGVAGGGNMMFKLGSRLSSSGAIKHQALKQSRKRMSGLRNFSATMFGSLNKHAKIAADAEQKAAKATNSLSRIFYKTRAGVAGIAGRIQGFRGVLAAKKAAKIDKKTLEARQKEMAVLQQARKESSALRRDAVALHRLANMKLGQADKMAAAIGGDLRFRDYFNPKKMLNELRLSQILKRAEIRSVRRNANKVAIKAAQSRVKAAGRKEALLNKTPMGKRIAGAILKGAGRFSIGAAAVTHRTLGIQDKYHYFEKQIKKYDDEIADAKKAKRAKQVADQKRICELLRNRNKSFEEGGQMQVFRKIG